MGRHKLHVLAINDELNDEWNTFVEKLEKEVFGDNTEPEEMLKDFKCDSDFAFTRKILAEIGNININATIEEFQSLGGYCDCEILWNVVQ